MKFLKHHTIWVICLLSFFSAFCYNQINLKQLPKELKRENTTVITNDDVSYLVPPKNYLETGVWKANSLGKQSYFIRTPGYGIFYLLFLKVAGYPLALSFLKIAQLLLFSISIYWLFSIAYSLLKNKKLALIVAAVYGLAPFSIGFLAYTLTEGITPALLLLFVFLLFKANEKTKPHLKFLFYIMASFSFAYLLIVRPPLGFIGILLPIFIIKDYWKESFSKLILHLFLMGSIAFSLMTIWQIRNYNITNQYVGLHSIYYTDNNSIYRPTFKEYWNFVGGWAQEGHEAYAYMVPLWQAAIQGDTSIHYINNAIATFPKEVVSHYGKERLISTFRLYQESILFQKSFYDKELPMPISTPKIEQKVMEEFKLLTKEYKSNFWLQYHVLSPIKVFRTMAFHSNLSLNIFQHKYRGTFLMETVRIVFYGLHALCFLILVGSLFFIRKMDWKERAITLSTVAYVFYLCYFQRGIEERYTLPILPLLVLGVVYFGVMLKKKLGRNSG